MPELHSTVRGTLRVHTFSIASTTRLRSCSSSSGYVRAIQGATVSGATVDSGIIYFFDVNTEVTHPDRSVVSGRNITIHANGRATFRGINARGSHIEVTEAGGFVCAQNGALVEDVTLNNGGSAIVYINNGTGCVDSGAEVTQSLMLYLLS